MAILVLVLLSVIGGITSSVSTNTSAGYIVAKLESIPCVLPGQRPAGVNFSQCQAAASANHTDNTCEATCARGFYGRSTVLSCPKYNVDPRQTWQGTMPTCNQCNSTERPLYHWRDMVDNCNTTRPGQWCSAVCLADITKQNSRRWDFTCAQTAGYTEDKATCACFVTYEQPLQCPIMNKCVAPDLGSGNPSHFDDSDCVGKGRVGNCSVRCAEGYEGEPEIFHCTGPPYITTGKLPSCHPSCTVREQPRLAWDNIADNCQSVVHNQTCTVGCASGFRGDQQPFKCWEMEDGHCSCFTGRKPYCQPDHFPCVDLPAVDHAEIAGDGGPVWHLGFATYQCAAGYTQDGTSGGSNKIWLQCYDGYLKDFETAGCAPVDAPPLRRNCTMNNTMKAIELDTSRCNNKVEGESCTVTCAANYYAPKHGRFGPAISPDQMPPTLLVCQAGVFQGRLPHCVKGDTSPSILEFDVYAAFRKGSDGSLLYESGYPVEKDSAGKSLPTNINVFDLEGLLNHLYTSLFFFQQQEAEIPTLFRDEGSGGWARGSVDPKFPSSRELVDTLVWYRLRVRNPSLLGDGAATRYEFGIFADFQHGGAANTDAQRTFASDGGVVGLEPQMPGFVVMYKARPGAEVTDAQCADPSWIGKPDWNSKCYQDSSPEFDPRYRPAGRLNRFSLPGECPNKIFDQKVIHGTPNPDCTTIGDRTLAGGRCKASSDPDGKPECTYSIQEIARLSIDDISGIKSQSCGGRACKDLRDFQQFCDSPALRKGVKFNNSGTIWRECVEYAVATDFERQGSDSCNKHAVEQGNVWSCFDVCNDTEASLPFFKGRCQKDLNQGRLNTLQSMFEAAAKEQNSLPKVLEYVQDCGKFTGCQPDTGLGLNYCERDTTGICGPCFIPNTTSFDPSRVSNLDTCSQDLFANGGYPASGDRPQCNTEAGYACCKYLRNCPRSWSFTGDWSECRTCGDALQYRSAVCPLLNTLGDCRIDLGDPSNSGSCSAGGGDCFAVQVCKGQSCPWTPFCSKSQNSAYVRREDNVCLPTTWGPLDSQCAWGDIHRYKHCSYYAPSDADRGGSYCSNSAVPWVADNKHIVFMKSRIDQCGRCDADGGPCKECAAPALFSLGHSGRCENSKPVLTLQLQVSLPVSSSDRLTQVYFQDLESNVAKAMGSAGAWSDNVFLLDAYNVTVADSSLPAEERTDRRLFSFRKQNMLPRLNSDAPATAPSMWTFVLALQLDGDPSSFNASNVLNQSTPRLQKELAEKLGNILESDAGSIGIEVGELTLLCPGLQVAPQPWQKCPAAFPMWIIVLIICGGVVFLGISGFGIWYCVRKRRDQ